MVYLSTLGTVLLVQVVVGVLICHPRRHRLEFPHVPFRLVVDVWLANFASAWVFGNLTMFVFDCYVGLLSGGHACAAVFIAEPCCPYVIG